MEKVVEIDGFDNLFLKSTKYDAEMVIICRNLTAIGELY